MDREHYDSLFKFLIVGNTSCGKTCLLHRFLKKECNFLYKQLSDIVKPNSTYTIGVEFGSEIINVDNKVIKLQIWDTAGQERFKSVARTYYRGALGALVVYDCTNNDSYKAVGQWIKDIRELARQDVVITVCSNKSDLQDRKVVDTAQALEFCKSEKVNFIETSALSGLGVQDAFVLAARGVLDLMDKGLIDPTQFAPKNFYGSGQRGNHQSKALKNQNQDKDGEKGDKKKGCLCG